MISSYYIIAFSNENESFPVEGEVKEEKSRIICLKKEIPLKVGTKMKIHLYRKETNFLYEIDFSFLGECDAQLIAPQMLELTRIPNKEERPMVHVLENAESAKEFIERFNTNIARDIIDDLDTAHVIIQGGNVPILESTKVQKQENTLILSPNNPKRITNHLAYNRHMKIFVPEMKGIKNIEISGIARKFDAEKIQVIPTKLSYGSHTEMETFHFSQKVSQVLKEEMKQGLSLFKFWWRITRAHIALFGMFSVLLAASLMTSKGYSVDWKIVSFIAIMVTAFLISSNLLNDYFDSIEDEYNPFASPLHGGSGAIQYELISREQTLLLSFITGITGTGFAFWILVERWNVNVFFLGILAVGIAILFSTPPFKLGSRGLGEILSSIEIGLLPFVGTYMYLSTKEFTIEFLLVGSYLVVLLFSWFLLTNLLDFIPDIRAEKQTLPTLIGQSRAIGLFKILFIGSFLIWSGILIIQQNGIYLIPIGLVFFLIGWKKISVPFQINDQAIKQILISNLLQLTLLTTALFF